MVRLALRRGIMVRMRDKDFAWLVAQAPRLYRAYAGKWIAVHNEQVIGVGNAAPEVAEQARKKAPDGEFILEALEPEADVISGSL